MAVNRSSILERKFYNWFNSGGDELMKKVKLIIAAVAMVSLVSSSVAYADGFAPGEGLYVGAFAGTGVGVVQPKVTTNSGPYAASTLAHQDGTFEATEGGIGLMGFEGGAQLGYGYKMGDLYIGLEGEYVASDVEFKLTSSVGVDISPPVMGQYDADNARNVTEVTAKKEWTTGGFGRVGVYINPSTLLSVRGGVLISKFEVAYTGQSETYYGGGPSFGVDMESTVSAIDPNLSFRIGAVYTDFLTAPVSGIGTDVATGDEYPSNSEVTGSALSARVGLQYSFFDVNSLF